LRASQFDAEGWDGLDVARDHQKEKGRRRVF